MKAYLAQIDGWNGSTATSVYLASHDDESVCHLNGQTWLPAISRLPVMRYDFFDGAFSGQIVAPTGEMMVQTEALGTGFPALALHDARLRIWQGELGSAWGGYSLIIDGRIEEQPEIADGVAQISIGVDDAWLDQPLLGIYAGTGSLEGGADLKGAVKPRLFGAPRFCDAVLIDAVNNVWQLSAGAINQVELAFDRLSRFGASTGDYASLAALIGAAIPAGGWGTCLAQGLVRTGAPADGLLTFHVRGDSGGTGGWVRKPGAIISRIAEIMGASAKVNAASLTALDTACPWNISPTVREQTTPRDLILRIAQSVNATPVIDWLGQLYVLPVPVPESATSQGTLSADGSTLPPVAHVQQQAIAPPFWRLAQQAEVTQRVHADSEIASIDLATAADLAAVETELANIASDSLLTPDEKPRVIQDRDAIVAEQSGIDAQASAFSITTEKTTYDTAVSALTTYLATLTSPVLWSNLTGDTTIVGTTFRQKFLDVYSSRQVLLNKIASEAAKRSDWSLVSGTGKPADNATRNVVTYSTTAPSTPVDGDLWVDTSGTYAIFKLRSGGTWVTGANALSAYNALSGKPVALADINTTESSKLSGIQAGATVGAPSGTNVGSTSATTVESGANKGNAGLDSSGNVLTDKVSTGSIVVGSVIVPGAAALLSDLDITTKGSWVDVLTTTITTIGQPVDVSHWYRCIGIDTSASSGFLQLFYLRLIRGATLIKQWTLYAWMADGTSQYDIDTNSIEKAFNSLISSPSGSQTFKLQVYLENSGGGWPGVSKLRFEAGSSLKSYETRR